MESVPNSSFSPRSLHAEAEGTALAPQSPRSVAVGERPGLGSGATLTGSLLRD
jgi:hypothetical protein